MDLDCTYMGIDKQLVKDERIKTKLVNFSLEIFNADGTKNGEVIRMALLEVEINGHKETLEVVVTDLNSMDMFLGHNQLVKHNPKVNWEDGKIQFTRYLGSYKIKHQNIEFKTKRTQATETQDKDKTDIGKEPDLMNPEDLLEYIQLFTHLFNKKKFEKLLERREQDHEINLMEEVLKELNAKAYAMTIKEKEALK